MSSIRERVTTVLAAQNDHKAQIDSLKKLWNTLLAEAKTSDELTNVSTELLNAGL
jgi:hypothetical protein